MRKDKDMTVGNPFKLIGTFSFSLIVGNLFQQLYTFVDTIIIGKKIGTLGLAAVGGTEWLIFLANGVIIGLVQGFCILLGNSFGEGNEREFEVYYARAKKICLVLAIALTIFFFFVSGPILHLLGTKDEVYAMAQKYINIIFLGIPFLVFYQLFSGALRSRGNSRIPLLAMTVSSLCNIVLDILFVNILEFGIAGAALGTIASECVVMLICGYHYNKEREKVNNLITVANEKIVTFKLIQMGIPIALQSVITSIGGLIVVNRINQYDITFLAGYTAAVKLYGLLEIAASSFGLAVVAYVAQNYGASKMDRIVKGIRASLLMGTIVAVVCSGVMIFGGKDILRLFIEASDTTEKMLVYGYRFLRILAVFFPFLYFLYILRAALQGINNTIVPMVSSFAQLLMRLFCAIILTRFIGSDGIFWGEVSAWIFADIILFMHTSTQMKFVSRS